MLLSIIIPIYNKEKTLKRCVDSILVSKGQDYEIVLVDDGSSDNSSGICKGFADEFPHIQFISQQNRGVSAARNAGLQLAQGRYIAFIDADDFVKETYFTQIKEALSHEADLYLFNYTRWLDANRHTKATTTLEPGEYHDSEVLTKQIAGLEVCLLSVWTAIYRADIIKDCGIMFRVGMKTCEDFLFNLDYIQNVQQIYASDGAAYCYYGNPNGVTSKRPLSHADDYEVVYKAAKAELEARNCNDTLIALFHQRWIRWCIDLVANWREQRMAGGVIWTKLMEMRYYNEIIAVKPLTGMVRIEQYLLKRRLDGLILAYVKSLHRIKAVLGRYGI